ncbi:hypothetical protein [Streptomyces sp. NPDC050759]
MRLPAEWFPGEEHWHSAAPDRCMTHLAPCETDDADTTTDTTS